MTEPTTPYTVTGQCEHPDCGNTFPPKAGRRFCSPKCRANAHRLFGRRPSGTVRGISASRDGWVVSILVQEAGAFKIGDRVDVVERMSANAADAMARGKINPVGKIVTMDAAMNLPPIPGPMHVACNKPLGIPKKPGVYFLWDDEGQQIQYVGSSRSLSSRLVTTGHIHIEDGTLVSYFTMPDYPSAFYAESYLIGVLKPAKNSTKLREGR